MIEKSPETEQSKMLGIFWMPETHRRVLSRTSLLDPCKSGIARNDFLAGDWSGTTMP